MITETQYYTAINLINSVHNQDPNSETLDGTEIKSELLYSKRMLQVMLKFFPAASLELRLAAQCQHMSRWRIPRSTFSKDKKGYYQWRAAIMQHQLSTTTLTLKKAGLADETIEIIVDALQNKADKTNINASIIEDTACLTFIKWYLLPFVVQFDPDKAKVILQKTADKMSERGLEFISELDLDFETQKILQLLQK